MLKRLVGVYQVGSDIQRTSAPIALPAVFSTPIRHDIVEFVHTNINRNKIQGHAVQYKAGMKHSAQSWGTGRAVARIPRVGGSGTHRSGQGAFGNMCRKGRMFAPIRIWRKWHRRVNIRQKRYAVASAIAASAVMPLVQARGHKIQKIPELPLVVNDNINKIQTTKEAIRYLKTLQAFSDIKKVMQTRKVRAGQGKARNRRVKSRKGPLVVYEGQNAKFINAFRNIKGIDFCNVNRLNLLQLAPGGHFGRFIIWTQSAFKALSTIFSKQGKHGFVIPRAVIINPDVSRHINSSAVQSKAVDPRKNVRIHAQRHGNPLTNKSLRDELNPFDKLRRQKVQAYETQRRNERLACINQKRSVLTQEQKKEKKENRSASKNRINEVLKGLKGAFDHTMKEYKDIRALQEL